MSCRLDRLLLSVAPLSSKWADLSLRCADVVSCSALFLLVGSPSVSNDDSSGSDDRSSVEMSDASNHADAKRGKREGSTCGALFVNRIEYKSSGVHFLPFFLVHLLRRVSIDVMRAAPPCSSPLLSPVIEREVLIRMIQSSVYR